ncbi:hypothetical protein, partial [Mesorhizobium sp. M1399]|uniref:hypothetical protein n=1 Tax=Mesorhizobium sp. M1399 TaxID=2957096 RepID=UPI003337CB5F
IGDCNVTTVPWPLALQSKRRSLSKTFCRTFRTLSLADAPAAPKACLDASAWTWWLGNQGQF